MNICLPSCSVSRSCGGTGKVSKKSIPVFQAALKKLKSRTQNGKAESGAPCDLMPPRFPQAAGLNEGSLELLGPSAWSPESFPPEWSLMVYSCLFFLPSSPSNWTYLKVPESLSMWDRNLVFRKLVLDTLWTETGNNPTLHVLLCGFYLCFLWNELRQNHFR